MRWSKTWSLRVFLVIALGALFSCQHAAAASPSWVDGDPTIQTNGSIQSDECPLQRIPIAMQPFTINETLRYESVAEGCVMHGATIDFAVQGRYSYVKLHGDRLFHRLITTVYDKPKLVEGTDVFFKGEYRPELAQPSIITVYKNLPSSLVPLERNDRGVVVLYGLNETKRTWLLGDSRDNRDGTYLQNRDVISYAVSANAKYMISYVDYKYVVKTDVETAKSTMVRQLNSSWSAGFDTPIAQTISNDGRYAYISKQEEVIDMKDCGDDSVVHNQAHLVSECPSRNIEAKMQSAVGYLAYGAQMQFSDDGQSMEGIVSPRSRRFVDFLRVWVGISGSPKPTQLEYLALGDSYTSGEGDTERGTSGLSYYLTDMPQTYPYSGFCHLSSRSYPFLLQQYYKIPNTAMNSVACSGARVVQDYLTKPVNYYGQKGDLKEIPSAERNEARIFSLNTPKPGVIPQLEFVKKYKPKIITVMGGGNDVGFGDILEYCAMPDFVFLAPHPYTCDYAKSDTELEKMLLASIDTQYAYMMKLVQQIKRYSPDSRIALIGYPSFISIDPGSNCGVNAGLLNKQEQFMIQAAVTIMNRMLLKVANDSNIDFVDIQDSLSGGRLCEGAKYMTGVDKIDLSLVLNKKLDPQVFHPNAKGHQQIAKTIIESGVFLKDPSNDPSNYVQRNTGGEAYRVDMVYGGRTVKTYDFTNIHLDSGTVEPGSSVVLATYSEKVELGTFTAKDDGSLDVSIETAKLPVGRHVLVAKALSPSGESLSMFQFISVAVTETDTDGDGINDGKDACMFIDHWYDEQTGKDVCAITVQPNSTPSNGNITPRQKDDTNIERTNLVSRNSVGQEPGASSLPKSSVLAAHERRQGVDWVSWIWWIIVATVLLWGGVYAYATSRRKHQQR
ncbi:hypothetical protein KBD87_00665 [Candidatus Saccharibacteria bacterium]|nr:hypothetical protein [Candidatus Saccharibacteria bacterium]